MSGFLPTVDLTAGANSSGSTSGIGRAIKNVRTRPELQLDKDDPTIDGNGQEVQGTGFPKFHTSQSLRGNLFPRSKRLLWRKFSI